MNQKILTMFGITVAAAGCVILWVSRLRNRSRHTEIPELCPTDCPNDADPETPYTAEELAKHKGEGSDPTDILVGVKGNIYKVSPTMYGPGRDYHCLAGIECSRLLGKSSLAPTEANADWKNLNTEHMAQLSKWETTFIKKYPVVGRFHPNDEYFRKGEEFGP